ncbi:Asp-tRNA(Asn)/Glu-tRNA(Gln) amidotransferase subunit GatC [Paracidobacterium acidisoli]|uniref:Aspartyl/glutamyl-tRNA(Asn/Gln) amidotransferase subunit C n=1 Tax=Paracidobacterium acidisoli TaxID=2303751 RepID=A0A372INN4_9BACT|nr:Asp-tRNA(Asn)/Glu-tRNA(Gln) amidotransferase subunit GatC [Paracidobacterium acidisoli]MBT9332183.1 Asp-tRNA(Asn)/Glu-tRNA(Gln) amidotransferase subunit GatC [Paracidobacterium acidisoli]
MTDSERVSLEDVRRVAELSSLELTTAEEPHMRRDLNAILDYVAQLNELDTSQVEPMAQVAEVLAASQEEINVLRPDSVVPCLDRAQVMVSAPETDGVFFKVPKVIER